MYRNDRKRLRRPSERVGTLSNAALPPPASADEEQLLVRALRGRDEEAFELLLDRYYSPMLRLARTYVRSPEEAEEVVQDTWLAVLAGIDGFERRSSLKTWVFRILVNRARTRAKREARLLPFSSLPGPAVSHGSEQDAFDPDGPALPDPGTALSWHGRGWEPPRPDDRVLDGELRAHIDQAVRGLPLRQQQVVTLRDLEGWSAEEVCDLLDLSESNQRVLLHRARSKVRAALERYFGTPGSGDASRAARVA